MEIKERIEKLKRQLANEPDEQLAKLVERAEDSLARAETAEPGDAARWRYLAEMDLAEVSQH